MGAKAILKSFFEMPFTKGFGPIVDDIDVLFYSINTAHKYELVVIFSNTG